MGMRMLIDSTHLEETRVVLVKGTRLEEFDYETSTKQVLKGNIYLARVTRVEPSLQAAFVEYGGNRHGFLAFGEIHPDYYQIPIADRQALLAQQAEEDARAAQDEEDELEAEHAAGDDESGDRNDGVETIEGDFDAVEEITPAGSGFDGGTSPAETETLIETPPYWSVPARTESDPVAQVTAPAAEGHADEAPAADVSAADAQDGTSASGDAVGEQQAAEGGSLPARKPEEAEEGRRPRRTNAFRRYKIQEVIKRRQIMLVQVVKEERGNKGAALTTYLSLAGRYCVLMPNTARGGGISRKIQSPADRKRLKAITSELDIPEGMGVIVRTAGMERSKPEIRRDFEYLLRTWDNIRERTLESTAPALIYEEADLIKRSIRDLYSDDIDEVLVEGGQGHEAARGFMEMLMPSHTDRVKLYQDKIPLFHRYQVEQQLDSMFTPTVQLRSGGYIVINPTEALVAIDINSGKSTREHNIEETAYKTNLEAAEEIARQLRLRDLAGLVVIDFIDMEDNRNIRNVERRLKECLRGDRARIQVGRISGFGLLEMSRQRLRPSLIESSTMPCPHCQGRGYVRSIESTALQVLRAIEEEGIRDRASEILVTVPSEVAVYLLNHKRDRVGDVERRYAMRVILGVDTTLVPPDYKIERSKPRQPGEVARPELVTRSEQRPITQQGSFAEVTDPSDDEADVERDVEMADAEGGSFAGEDGGGENELNPDGTRRRRRRRRRRGRRPDEAQGGTRFESGADFSSAEGGEETSLPIDGDTADGAAGTDAAGQPEGGEGSEDSPRRRRGRRGGRRRRRDEPGSQVAGSAEDGAAGDGEMPADDGLTVPPPPARRPYAPEGEGFMTPAALGAMLDGRPSFEFDDEEPVPARPAAPPAPVANAEPAPRTESVAQPVAEPVAAPVPQAAAPAPVVEAPVSVAPAPVAAVPAAPAPVAPPMHTGPVFETVVVAPDGSTDRVDSPPPAPKRGWWSR